MKVKYHNDGVFVIHLNDDVAEVFQGTKEQAIKRIGTCMLDHYENAKRCNPTLSIKDYKNKHTWNYKEADLTSPKDA